MSRFELGGQGSPIPNIALPDPNIDETLPVQTLVLEDGVPFVKSDWVGLGYTNFEVWCVGGAGGRGGDESKIVIFLTSNERLLAPANIWNAHLARLAFFDSRLNPPKDFYNDYYTTTWIPGNPNYIPGGVPGADYGWPMTHYQYVEYYNPQHLLYVSTYRDPILTIEGRAVGGGGGGGGIHRVTGLLIDIPEVTPVEVAQAGVDADNGQTTVNGPWTPLPWEIENFAIDELGQWRYRYSEPRDSFLPPQSGGDGGASSFGDIAKASGGKGGKPGKVWDGAAFVVDAAGGAGGLGGSDIPGGGGAGSNSAANGQDGPWDGTVGGGGGGGRGGTPPTPGNQNYPFPPSPGDPGIPPTDGGRGAFSYADTSIFGARGVRPFLVKPQYQFNYETGDIITTTYVTTRIYLPGGGGGVRANRKLNYGSRAPTYDPSGLVMIRLFKAG